MVFILLTPAVAPVVISGQGDIKQASPSLDIQVHEDAEIGRAVITLRSSQPVLDKAEVVLPDEGVYSESLTKELNEQSKNTTIKYDNEKHKLHIQWNESVKKQEATFVLTDSYKEEMKLTAIGIIDEKQVTVKENTIFIPQQEKAKKMEEANRNDQQDTSVKESVPPNKQQEDKVEQSKNTAVNKQTDKPMQEKQAKNASKKKELAVEPMVGNENIDIDLSPLKSKVLSGKQAVYQLSLKFTGSKTTFNNAKMVISLPEENFSSFTQSLDELKINGVTPNWDKEMKQLIYHFDSIKSGKTYETIIRVNTENGMSPNGEKLLSKVTFSADELEAISDQASIIMNASTPMNVSKKYIKSEKNGEPITAPVPGSKTLWEIQVNIPKGSNGQMFLQENETLVLEDILPKGLEYDAMEEGKEPIENKGRLTWEYASPTLEQQKSKNDSLFTKKIRVWLKVKDKNTVETTQNNIAKVKAHTIDGEVIEENAEQGLYIIDAEDFTGEVDGTFIRHGHLGPLNGAGELNTDYWNDKNPVVSEEDIVTFAHNTAIGGPNYNLYQGDFKQYVMTYRIDPRLHLEQLKTPGEFFFRPITAIPSSYTSSIPLDAYVGFDIYVSVNGREQLAISDADHNKVYTRADLGVDDNDRIEYVKYDFFNSQTGNKGVPQGIFTEMPSKTVDQSKEITEFGTGLAAYEFTVNENETGKAKNILEFNGINSFGDKFEVPYKKADGNPRNDDFIGSPRHVTISKNPPSQPPVATIDVELLEQDGGKVITGKNRMSVNLNNDATSTEKLTKKMEASVLLPAGVTVDSNPNAKFSGQSGKYEVLSDDYNNSGRQLVKFTWDNSYLQPGRSLSAQLNVMIAEYAPNYLLFDVYGFSGNEALKVPDSQNQMITSTILQMDEDDLNQDGNKNQPRLKSGNEYVMTGNYNLETEKFVKGALDDTYTNFGKTTPGGFIDYRLKITNTTGKDIYHMTLIDVLPSEGDLGITDNVERGSKFTPTLTEGGVHLPKEWQEKVDILYSSVQTPKRDDLIRHTDYPETATPLTNPPQAEEPNWLTADEVTDWNQIRSFKLEMKDDVQWLKGHDIEIEFRMKAPQVTEGEAKELLDSKEAPSSRAAWNSFAIATDNGQPVEPARVGVYMEETVDPNINKTVNGKESLELENRNQAFMWEVDFDFGNRTGKWDAVELSDTLHELLEIVEVEVVDQAGKDVSSNGELNVNKKTNFVSFKPEKKDNSYHHLQDQVYTLKIKSKIKGTATPQELLPYIEGNGIPNEAVLTVDDKPTTSNEAYVKPPELKGSLTITKIDKEKKNTLPGAEFELQNKKGDVIATKTTDDKGEITFEHLPLGDYQLVETKAPTYVDENGDKKTYRLLSKPIDISIAAGDLHVQKDIENSKSAWALPSTGGIGSFVFYAVGALLMIGAIVWLLKRRKQETK